MSIEIGKYSYLNEPYSSGWYNNACLITGEKPVVKIGRYTSIGKNCQFILTQHNYKKISTCPDLGDIFCRDNIVIGNDVWLGMNVTILDNTTIGDGAVIGAGSVVSGAIPPYAIAVGNPAKIIKYRFSPDEIEKLCESKWWELEKGTLQSLGINTTNVAEFLERLQDYKLPLKKEEWRASTL